MLHAPMSESKADDDRCRNDAVRMPAHERHQSSGDSADAILLSDHGWLAGGPRRALGDDPVAASSPSRGNQAMLRMRARGELSTALRASRTGVLQRKCACGGSAGISAECAECREKHDVIQRRGADRAEPDAVPPIVHDVLQEPGQPLDDETRLFMEPSFGHDFSRVRVHTDGKAAASARAVHALAFTAGDHIVFAAGRYAPATDSGRLLLAHELAHTVQQRGNPWPSEQASVFADATGAAENEAEAAARAVSLGLPARMTVEAPKIARADDEEPQQSDAGPAAQPSSSGEGQHACVKEGKEKIPDGNKPSVIASSDPGKPGWGVVFATFEVDIEWEPMASRLEPIHAVNYCDCSCGEYRQFVKGHARVNGVDIKGAGCGGSPINDSPYTEDATPSGNCYGHRDQPGFPNDVFDQPDRVSGCHYHGKDQPMVQAPSGSMIDWDLTLKCQSYDNCNGKFGPVHEWRVTYQGAMP